MVRHNGISEITKEFLDGTLRKLTMQYTDPDTLRVSIMYNDSNDYYFDYDMEINSRTELPNFLSHKCKTQLFKLNLGRTLSFENAVSSFILGSK